MAHDPEPPKADLNEVPEDFPLCDAFKDALMEMNDSRGCGCCGDSDAYTKGRLGVIGAFVRAHGVLEDLADYLKEDPSGADIVQALCEHLTKLGIDHDVPEVAHGQAA